MTLVEALEKSREELAAGKHLNCWDAVGSILGYKGDAFDAAQALILYVKPDGIQLLDRAIEEARSGKQNPQEAM